VECTGQRFINEEDETKLRPSVLEVNTDFRSEISYGEQS